MERMAFMTDSMCAASAPKFRLSSYFGQSASMRNLPSCGMACQISSVMNGMNGCSSRRNWSST